MKKTIIAIVILVAIIVAGVLEDVFIHKTFTALDGKLAQLQTSIEQQDEDAKTQVKDVINWWEKKRNLIEMIAFSPDVRAFSVTLAQVDGSLQCNDYQNAQSMCASLIVMSHNLHRLLDFNVEDII